MGNELALRRGLDDTVTPTEKQVGFGASREQYSPLGATLEMSYFFFMNGVPLPCTHDEAFVMRCMKANGEK